MGGKPSTPVRTCLVDVCNSRPNCLGWFTDKDYNQTWIHRHNLAIQPADTVAVVRPVDRIEVSLAVVCGSEYRVPVQAQSGGHSFGYEVALLCG
jgi:FAD/FMN-containing dehydrogenase